MSPESRIAEVTIGTPWEYELWLVGGCVRDPLLGETTSPDIDIVLESDALKLARWLYKRGIGDIPPVTYPRFGTALIRVDNTNVEIATARRESYAPYSRKPTVEFGSLEEDALRRDFTVNSVFKNLHTGQLFDITGSGLADIHDRILRTPVNPDITFRDDPLRMLRAIRFKNRFKLTPTADLWHALIQERHRLEIVSAERIRDEFSKMLTSSSAANCLRDLMEVGLLAQFAPELCEMQGVEQGGYHTKDVWEHTLDVIERASQEKERSGNQDLALMLGALLHDVAKPVTKSVDTDGRIRFFGHEKVGAKTAAKMLRRLRYSQKLIRVVSALVAHHMRLGSAVPFTKSAARRLVRDLGSITDLLVLLVECDATAIGRTEKGIDFADVRAKLAGVVVRGPTSEIESPLSGEEIMEALGLRPGPTVGSAKRKLTEAVLEGKLAGGDKAGALELLRETFPAK